jgi:hypothetical protein
MILGIYHPEPSDPSSVVIKSSPLVITTELKEGKKLSKPISNALMRCLKRRGKNKTRKAHPSSRGSPMPFLRHYCF